MQDRSLFTSKDLSSHPWNARHSLLGLGQTDSALAQIVYRVVLSQEGVTEDGQGAHGLWEVHTHERADAAALHLEDVVVRSNGEVVATKGERHVRKTVTLVTLNSVLAVVALLGTHLLVEELGKGGWECDEGRSGVKYNTSVVKFSSGIAESNGVKINLPVSLTPKWDVGHLAGVVVLVDATKGDLRDILLTVGSVTKVEGEDWLIKESLINHVVEGRDDLVDGNGIITKTHNSVESAKGKGESWLLCGLREVLVLDLQVADGDGVLGNVAAETARAIADLEVGTVLLVGRGRGSIVLGVKVASNGAALSGRNPKV